MVADQRELLPFNLALIFLCDRKHKIGDVIEVGDALVVRMVRNDQWNFAVQLSILMAVEKVLQAVILFGNEDGDAGTIGQKRNAPGHLKLACERSKTNVKFRKRETEVGDVELNAGQEEIRLGISVLIVGEDVAVIFEDEVSDRGNDTFAVGTGNEKNSGGVHEAKKAYYATPTAG